MDHTDIILAVDDDEDFVLLLQWALERTDPAYQLLHVNDGREAIRYLSGESKYGDRKRYPLPTLMLLDIHLPVMDGFEVMAWLRRQPALSFPVLMLTSSGPENQSLRARRLGVTGLREKPFTMSQMRAFAEMIRNHPVPA